MVVFKEIATGFQKVKNYFFKIQFCPWYKLNVSSTIYKPDLCHTKEHSTGDGGPAVSHQHQAGYDFPWPPPVF